MISYSSRAYLRLVLRWSGSLIWSKVVVIPTAFSCVICVVIFNYRDELRVSGHLEWPVWVYSTVISFAIIFRTSLAYARYFDGVTASLRMVSFWRSAYVSLLGFVDASVSEHRRRGNSQIVEEVLESKTRLLRWFSLLFAVAVQTLQWRQDPDVLRPMQAEEELLEVRRKFWSRITDFDRCDRVHIHESPTREEFEVLSSSFDKLTVIVQWIETEVTQMHLFNRIFVHSSILTRIYEEISDGMLAYCEAHTIAFIPFPFLFAQVLGYALYTFSVVCPFIVLSTLAEQEGGLQGERWSWPALVVMNSLLVGGFASLNEIAIELEDPFVETVNNFPLRVFQRRVDLTLTESCNIGLPTDFTLASMGKHNVDLASSAKAIAIEKALEPTRRTCLGGPEAVTRIVDACEDLRLRVVSCMQDVESDDSILQCSMSSLEEQLVEAVCELFLSKGLSAPPPNSSCRSRAAPSPALEGDPAAESHGSSAGAVAARGDGARDEDDRLLSLLRESAAVNREMSQLLMRDMCTRLRPGQKVQENVWVV